MLQYWLPIKKLFIPAKELQVIPSCANNVLDGLLFEYDVAECKIKGKCVKATNQVLQSRNKHDRTTSKVKAGVVQQPAS